MFRRTIALSAFLLLALYAFAQGLAVSSPEDSLAKMSELERKTLTLDIAVSNYYELAAMASSYGLSTEGTSEALRSRIYQYLKLSPPENPTPASSMTIESASAFESFTLEGSKDRFIRLTGPITMSIKTDDGFSHKVTADEITFNRDKNVVQARGNVVYVRTGEGRSDEFTGSSIVVDLGSYSGVFLDGAYDLDPTASVQRSLSFHFEKLIRRSSALSMLENAIVTGCDEVPPHYHIRARKVWLFENGDWALSGATLYLGVVPVLWLPFFYYPSDEILFHPVVGYRSREGAFLQTTTYFLGEKKKDSTTSSSLSLFSQQSTGGEKEVSGIFIRRLQSTGKGTGTTNTSPAAANPSASSATAGGNSATAGTTLKLLADIYSALGVYIGVAGNLPDRKSGSLDFSLGFGLSRSLFLESTGYYSPFDSANSNASVWNSSNFLGFDLPLRFGLTASYAYKKTSGPLRLSISFDLPLYSDPYFEQDFYQRNESSGILSALDANTTTVSKRSTMTQNLQSTLSWTAPNSKGKSLLENATVFKTVRPDGLEIEIAADDRTHDSAKTASRRRPPARFLLS